MSEFSLNLSNSPTNSSNSFKSIETAESVCVEIDNGLSDVVLNEGAIDCIKKSEDINDTPDDDDPKPDISESSSTTLNVETDITEDMDNMELNNTENDWDNKEWQDKGRHIFILSSSGKPIYSRYGNEDKLATLFGVMQALVSFVEDTNDDKIKSIKAGGTHFSFLSKSHLIIVSVSKKGFKEEFLLQRQLLYVYNQIISTLTLSQLTRIYKQFSNYDMRKLVSGSERLISTLVDYTETKIEFIMSAYGCLSITTSNRDNIANVITTACSKIKNLVFAILIAKGKVVVFIHMKKYNLQIADIHLIINLVESSASFKTAEMWTPLCLPQFDASGYLYMHVSYLADDCDACLLLMTVDMNLFFTLSEARNIITEKLRRSKLLDVISESILTSNDLLTSKLGITSLRHFVYKCKTTSQLIYPQVEAPYLTCPDLLLNYYSKLFCDIHKENRQLKVSYFSRDTETLLGWTTAEFELYLVFEPLVPKPAVINAVTKLLRWVKSEESKAFMKNNYIF